MKKRPFIWFIYPTNLLVAVLSLSVLLWYGADYLTDFYYQQKAEDLEVRARLTGSRVLEAVSGLEGRERVRRVNDLCRELGRSSNMRITVVLQGGEVIGDSEEDPARMDNHAGRPEIRKALGGETGLSLRYSATLEENLMYVAVPLDERPELGVVRVSVPVTSLEQIPRRVLTRFATVSVVVLLAAAGLSFLVARRIVKPLEIMKSGAEELARGKLETRLPVSRWEEIGSLAEEMNRMAASLDDRIRRETSQKNEMEAVLGSMAEGVLALDLKERVLSLNRAARAHLGVRGEDVVGRTMMEVVRNPALHELVVDTLSGKEPVEGEVIFRDREEKYLQVHGTVLRDSGSVAIGALIVMNDVTRLRKLEEIRRDFVANASHEIRTPVTSIKGFVETLLDGALEDKETTERFLEIIGRHADRLNAIVEDLLSLSSIEKVSGREEVSLEERALQEVVEEAIELCRAGARKKDVALKVRCGEDITARVNPSLLVQAVVNLVDNAVKFSLEGGEVEVQCHRRGAIAVIEVRDRGCGIAREDIPRLFERFYRADKARSRELGGTGLGLAIVKHIVQVHGGEVTVDSEIGQGSTFAINLPAASDRPASEGGAGEGVA